MKSNDLPEPEAGMVVRFQYQWADQQQPVKDRPVCIMLVRKKDDSLDEVVYLPISTQPPHSDKAGIEIPPAICRLLGFRETKCWIVVSECNVQYWPNDINRIPSRTREWHYGFMPPKFFRKINEAFRQEIRRRKSAAILNVHYLPTRK